MTKTVRTEQEWSRCREWHRTGGEAAVTPSEGGADQSVHRHRSSMSLAPVPELNAFWLKQCVAVSNAVVRRRQLRPQVQDVWASFWCGCSLGATVSTRQQERQRQDGMRLHGSATGMHASCQRGRDYEAVQMIAPRRQYEGNEFV